MFVILFTVAAAACGASSPVKPATPPEVVAQPPSATIAPASASTTAPATVAASARDANAFYAGKFAVVSGADGGIGAALVEALLERGATVFAGSRRPQPSAALQQLARAHGASLHILPLDVTRPQSIALFRQKVSSPRVDLLFNAAGVNIDKRARLLDAPGKRLEDTLAVNLVGAVHLTQALGPLLHNCGSPVVANLSSVMGSMAENRIGGSPSYRISKAAMNMFSKELAVEEPGVVALSLHPGWVQTKMGGENADVSPRDSAAGILAVVARATLADSGAFFRYSGERVSF